jgi:hypothetical protein
MVTSAGAGAGAAESYNKVKIRHCVRLSVGDMRVDVIVLEKSTVTSKRYTIFVLSSVMCHVSCVTAYDCH